jgi:hypothetical protein
MKGRISRRSLLLGLGGGLAATSIAWSIGGLDLWRTGRREDAPAANSTYIDHDGWMLTIEDKPKLLGVAKIRHLDNTNLPGSDIGSRVVTDLSACALWCVTDPRCRSFAYTKTVADADRPNTCWIKNSVPEAMASELFISGIIE